MEARHIPFMLMCISLGYSDIQILLFSLRLNIAFFCRKVQSSREHLQVGLLRMVTSCKTVEG